MIKYKCKHCDDLICETSICPVCGNRTTVFSREIFYCDKCNAPSFEQKCPICHSECRKIGTDLRPVFAQERLLIETLLHCPMKYAGMSIWSTNSNTYWIDGKKLRVSLKELSGQDPDQIIRTLNDYKEKNEKYVINDLNNEHIHNFVSINRSRLNQITEEAIEYIQEISQDFDTSSMFVSFSGGKDSTVTSHLVMRALDTEKVMHIYGDTTLEYPSTGEYIKIFKSRFPNTPMLVAKNKDQNFNDLCDVVGPPSRVMRWCCTIFKTGAITRKIEQIFREKKRLISFQGIRRFESASRSKYDRDSSNSKIAKQISSSPIIDWMDFDVWLYILANNIPFNGAYRQGFSRVGCWCCPNNSGWSEFLSSIYMNTEYKEFHNTLYKFARKVGKQDWKEYVDKGKWKARQGGNGLEYSENAVISFKPCALEENALNFDLAKPISTKLYELFKPFGIINNTIGNKRLNEVYVLDRNTNEPILKLTGRIGSKELRVTILRTKGVFSNQKTSEKLIKNQITKYQTCIGCSYCQSVCKYNALKVVNLAPGNVSNESISYKIDSNKCVGCLECVTHFEGGCYMKKVLRTKKEK